MVFYRKVLAAEGTTVFGRFKEPRVKADVQMAFLATQLVDPDLLAAARDANVTVFGPSGFLFQDTTSFFAKKGGARVTLRPNTPPSTCERPYNGSESSADMSNQDSSKSSVKSSADMSNQDSSKSSDGSEKDIVNPLPNIDGPLVV